MTEKTPEEMAQKEVNKRVGKALADLEIKVREYKAKIKKLEKKKQKVLDGEIVPPSRGSVLDDIDDDEDDSSSDSTKVTILLDESGSMNTNIGQTISGFNEYIDKLRKDKGKFLITLTKFNSNKTNVVYRNKNVKKVPKLSNESYRPNGVTPLYDAIGKTAIKKEKGNNLFIIITDGYENASKEYTLSDITTVIKDCEKLGWTFIYLGADQDAWANAKGYGLSKGNVMSFSSMQMGRTMSNLAGSTISYSASKKPTKKFFKDHY